MSRQVRIEGIAAPLPVPNLDTDQIMPKQFLRGIDKAGLDQGVLYDLRFDAGHRPRPDCVLNRPGWQGASILVGGSNFGCGSSREHAVWGLLQFGIRAVIAPGFGEIFYNNAMNNGLLLVVLDEAQVRRIQAETADARTNTVTIDVVRMAVRSHGAEVPFTLSERHRHMFLKGVDMIGATLALRHRIDAFQARHWRENPWLREVGARSLHR
jgi:3-isopropylmalate/(R)-2-methylmalate dehydratase small subunit